jgi:hypothetical protein
MNLNSQEEHKMKKKISKLVMAGLIVAAMAAPLPALAAWGNGPRANARVAQTRTDCPNGGQQLRDGSGRTRKDSLHQNRGAGLRDGTGPRCGAGNCGPAQN